MFILAAILAILAAAILLVPDPRDAVVVSESKPLFSLSQDGIVAFQINNFLQSHYFKRDNGKWLVKRVQNDLAKAVLAKDPTAPVPSGTEEFAEADPVKVAKLLTHLTTLTVGLPVATEKGSMADFQINENSLHVILFGKDGQELGRLFVGKQASDYLSSFVKRNRENEIYLVSENLGGLLLYPYEDWLIQQANDDKTPAKTNKSQTHGKTKGKKTK